jgi:glycosyltransferase involved in cell wall biosynthesis
MLNSKSITLIIPCRNEERAISKMLKKVPKCVDEIIVVDNGSLDNTVLVAQQNGAKILFESRQTDDGIGYGFAHQKGMEAAHGEYIIAIDGDNTYPLRKIPEVIAFMQKHETSFVSCNRFPLINSSAVSFIRRLGVKILNWQVQVLYSYPMKDILSGMWAMKRETAKNLFLTRGGWNFSPEIKLAALRLNRESFAEYHIPHTYRYEGESKQRIWRTGISHLGYIFYRRLVIDPPNLQVKNNLQKLLQAFLQQVISRSTCEV